MYDVAVPIGSHSPRKTCSRTHRTWPQWPRHCHPTTGSCGAWLPDHRTSRQTGLDQAKDEIIELGMVKFDYTGDGWILGVRETFSAFKEPAAPLSAAVMELTGITNEMVAGNG